MSSRRPVLVPRLQLPRTEPVKSFEFSPRSDEMNEEISSIKTPRSFSLAPDQMSKLKMPRSSKANTPLNSCVQKSDKNPLVRQTSSFVGMSGTQLLSQTEDFTSLLYENQSLRHQLLEQEQELKQLRRVKVLLRQKDTQLERAEMSLKLAMQESEQLAQELRLRQDCSSGVATLADDEEPKLISNPIHIEKTFKSEGFRRERFHVPSRLDLSMQKFKRKLKSYIDCAKD